MEQEYIQSGRFIHDELLRRCELLIVKVVQLFRQDKRVYPSMLIWPVDTVMATNGTKFSGVIFTELSVDQELRKVEVRESILRCLAFGALVTEQLDDCVRLIFESQHGTRTWRLPIKDYGGIQVLEHPQVHDNAESIGVLWLAN